MMLFLSAVLAMVFMWSTIAQSATQVTGNASETKAVVAATHTVSVGANGHHFEPSETKANVGDVMEFLFYPQNHSVARANFGQPCIPYEITGPGKIGFWSGFRPLQVVLPNPPRFQVQINDTEPIFYYCSAPGACLDGMVGVINPNFTQTFAIQHELTENATQEFSPGETYFKPEVGSTRTQSLPVPSSTSGATAGGNFIAAEHPHGLSAGIIVGIVLATIFAVVIAAVVIYICGRQRTISEVLHRQSAAANPTSVYHPDLPGYAEAQYPNIAKPPMRTVSSSTSRYCESPYRFGVAAIEDGGRLGDSSPPIDERSRMVMYPRSFGSLRSDGTPHPVSPGYSLFDSYREEANQKPPLHQLPPHRPTHPSENFSPVELPVPLPLANGSSS